MSLLGGAQIADLWQRLDAFCNANTKRSLRLRPGATEAEIAAAEKTMGLAFPSDFRASLLLHDGQEAEDDTFEWMPGCSPLASLERIVERWTEERDMDEDEDEDDESDDADDEDEHEDEDEDEDGDAGMLDPALYHRSRIPIAGTPFWDGDNTYIDLHPGAKGTSGQLITFVSESDLEVLGASFGAALEAYVTALERGDWVYSEAKAIVTAKGEPTDEYPNESYEFAEYVRARGGKS